MTITVLEQQDAVSNTAGISFTLSGATVGDTIYLLQTNDWYTLANLQTPTGTAVTTWTLKFSFDNGTNAVHAKIWEGVVTTGGASTVVVNSSTTDEERYAGIWRVPAGTTFGVAQSNIGASSTSHVAPSVTPTAGNIDDLLIAHFMSMVEINYTMPGSMVAYAERDLLGFTTNRSASEQLTVDTATGTRTATASQTAPFFGFSFLVETTAPPAAPPTSGYVPSFVVMGGRLLRRVSRIARGFIGNTVVPTAPTVPVLNQVVETDVAQPIGRLKAKAIGQVTETSVTQPINHGRLFAIGQVTETDITQPITHTRARIIGQVTETDVARPIGRLKAKAIGEVVETDVAQPITHTRRRAIGQVTETDVAQPLTHVRSRTVGQVTETDVAQPIAHKKTRAIGQVVENDLSQPVVRLGAGTHLVGQVTETDIAQTIASKRKAKAIGQITQAGVVQPITARKSRAIGMVTETDFVTTFTHAKSRLLGQVVGTNFAGSIHQLHVVHTVVETSIVQPVTKFGIAQPRVPDVFVSLERPTVGVVMMRPVIPTELTRPHVTAKLEE